MNADSPVPASAQVPAPDTSPDSPPLRWRAHHALALLPTIGMLGGLGFANRVHPLVLGLPFLFAWLAGWVIATSLVMGCILLLDDRAQRRWSAEDQARGANPAAGTRARTR